MTDENRGPAGAAGTPGTPGAAGAEGAVGRQGQQGEEGPAAFLDPATAKVLKRNLRILMVATVVLYLTMVAVATYGYFVSRGNLTALCALRADRQHELDRGLKLLAEHPEDPVRAFGLVFPRAQLLLSVAEDQKTVDALGNLSCPARP